MPEGMGCFAKGCLTILIIGFVLMAGMIGGTWYLCRKAADVLTSSEPANIQIEPPTAEQIRAAENAVTRVKTATGPETTVIFTAADLNALLDQNSDLEDLQGRTRIDIANSNMTVTMSVPLDELTWKRLRGRWFNASTTFSFSYAFGVFRIDMKSAEANGHHVPKEILSGISESFNDGFNENFHDEFSKGDHPEFWNHVKTMSLEGDKLVVTTRSD